MTKYRKEDMIGLKNQNKQGYWMEIASYKNVNIIQVKFDIDNTYKNTSLKNFINGNVKKIENRTGEKKFNKNCNQWMEIIEYNAYNNIKVRFEDGFITNADYGDFKMCFILNPYRKSYYGIGYIGDGKYKTMKDNKFTKQYSYWSQMLKRCYSNKDIFKAYIGCSVCEEWHNLQNFGKWFDENYYEIENEKIVLEKDLLIKNNKTYKPESCVFLPAKINGLITIRQNHRGSEPIGVYKHAINNNYVAHSNNGTGKIKHIGVFDSPEKAFYAYKKFKEDYVKSVAEYYKNKIPNRAYNALINWTINIDD